MKYTFDSRLGEQLYRLLPEVYRTYEKKPGRAGRGKANIDLAKYLDAHGHLLDLIHGTLKQQLKDALPGSSQDWLLPYFAQLLAVNIVSPESAGRQAEIAHAVSWRQRKGTLKCAEEIAEAVGQMEVEIQEGWKRVAMTPRIGMPLMPAAVLDDTLVLNMAVPSEANRHPALPVTMVDLRRASRAGTAQPTNPAARISRFSGVRRTWHQVNHHGVPCSPGSFDDTSRRTVDIRTPDAANGRCHHKRLLAFVPPPIGFFGLEPEEINWEGPPESLPEYLIEVQDAGGVLSIRNRTNRAIVIPNDVTLEARKYQIEGLRFQGALVVPEGGTLEITGVEAEEVRVETKSIEEFVLTACDSLFGVLISKGRIKLDSCTVLDKAEFSALEALDCIFMDFPDTDITGVIAYSRIPEDALLDTDKQKLSFKSHHPGDETRPVRVDPRFIPGQAALAARAVLSPNAPAAVYKGASDRREMGYYHRGRRNRPVHIKGDATGWIVLSPPADGGYHLKDLIFDNDVTGKAGRLVLIRSAAPVLTVATPFSESGQPMASITATDCLFKSIQAAESLVRLEYCTVMEDAVCKHLQASDCIFAGNITGVEKQTTNKAPAAFLNCIRYSSIPSAFLTGIKDKPENNVDKKMARALELIDREGRLTLRTNTLERPDFDDFYFCKDHNGSLQAERRKAGYGEWGYGVPGPNSAHGIRFGAEDGGEMGAFHHRHYSLKMVAVLEKMREFLPVGIEPVLIPDTRLLHFWTDKANSGESTGNGGGS